VIPRGTLNMQLCLTLEHRFFQTPDQKIWTITQCPYDFYREYLEVFDSVRVISRAFPVPEVQSNYLPVEGPGVSFYAMPGYKGPFGFLQQFSNVRQKAKDAVPEKSAVILRLPSQVGNSVEGWLSRRDAPYGLEVVADPYDVLSPAANRHVVAPIARQYFTRKLQKQCKRAIAISYVTQGYLQKRYPPLADQSDGLTTSEDGSNRVKQYAVAVSDANLAPESFVSEPRGALRDPASLCIVFVGTLESLYKGPDLLIDAVALCAARGLPVRVRFLGIGQQTAALRKRCSRLGIETKVEFVGSVRAGEGVRHELDQADLFVLPSRAEGVPRAMLEAMARGLPCIGSAIGGIPELLHSEDLAPPDDVPRLAEVISQVFSDRERLRRMSARNLAKAHSYSAALLAGKRQLFFKAVKDLTSRTYTKREQGEYLAFSPVSTVPA
jgi:glycosyltransferase involved in cell wall biosynthesis